ncbi:MAG: hypothetical protein U0Y10_06895 [Spirosomataceae bacterium]
MRFLLLLCLLSPSLSFAQIDSTKTVESVLNDTTTKAWEISLNLGVNLSHTMQVNSKPNAGKEGFSTTNNLDLGLNYSKKNVLVTNEFHWQFSLYRSGIKALTQKTADELISLHDFSVGLTHHNTWGINLIAKSNTGIFSTFKDGFFRDTTGQNLVQGFLNPYEFVLSPGVKWQPTKYLRISASPYTIRFYGLIDQKIANTGLYTTDKQSNGIDFVRSIVERQSAELNIWYDRKVKKWLQMQYRLGIKSSYAETVLNNGTMDGLFITKLKLIGNIYLTHRATLRGTFEQKPFKPIYSQVITLSYAITF